LIKSCFCIGKYFRSRGLAECSTCSCADSTRQSTCLDSIQSLIPSDKITIRIYDSDGNALNDLFKNKSGLLNPYYFKNMYTTVVIKVDEIDKSLVAKK
jgi:hypothetical protein